MAITGTRNEDVQVTVGADSSSLRDQLQAGISKLTDFRTAAGLAGGALALLAAKGLADATSAAADFEEQMARVERVTDPQTAEQMNDAILEMANRMPVAHDELATIAETAGRLGVEGENLEEFSESVAMMSTSTDLAADEAADAFARISTLMDLPMEDSELLGSAINELANNFGTSATEITDAMTRAGGAMNTLGVGEDEALGLAAAMNEVSPSARVAGTSLRNVAESLMEPSTVQGVAEELGMTEEEFRAMRDEDPAEVIEMLAVTMADGGDEAEQLREVLGKQASDLQQLGSNMDSVQDAQSAANEQFEEGTALQEEFETASSTVNAQWEMLQNRLRGAAITTGQRLLPAVAQVLDWLNNGIDTLVSFNEQTDGMVGVVGAAAAGIVGLIGVLTAATAVAGPAAAAVAAFGTAVTVATGPVGLLIALIAALAAIWMNDVAGIRTATVNAFGAIREALQPFISLLRDRIGEALSLAADHVDEVTDLWLENFNRFVEFVRPPLEALFEWLLELRAEYLEPVEEEFWETVEVWQAAFESYVEWLMPYVETAVEWLVDLFEDRLELIQEFWDEHGETIMAIVNQFIEAATVAFESLIDAITSVVAAGLALLRGDFEGAFEILSDMFDRQIDRWTEYGENLIDALIDGILGVGDRVSDAVEDVLDDARDYMPFSPAKKGPLDDLDESGRSIPVTLADQMSAGINVVSSAAEDVASAASPEATATAPGAAMVQSQSQIGPLLEQLGSRLEQAIYQAMTSMTVVIETDDAALEQWVDSRARVVAGDEIQAAGRQADLRGIN